MQDKTNQYNQQGQRHGYWEDYYRDGTVYYRKNYINNKICGLYEYTYFTDRTIKKEYHAR
jgi:antitoxin component YwqK of YwqJK toxin-antitoxin module